jgi:SRSO17 transposase
MDVHARPAALPEVPAWLKTFQVRCRRPEGGHALARSMTGRLTELPTKHGETMAQALPAPSAQRWQACLTHRPWDAEDRTRQRVQTLMAEVTLGDGVVVDDPGGAKHGQGSVGVARPYAGTLGQGGICQGAVTCGSTDPQATWPVAGRWYLPEAWAEDAERRQQARVPAAVTGHTKPELALSRLEQARGWGVP